ncbi:MAG: hypothetical protein U9N01_03485 [Euryarchaeota archaeon]|nr:hypothetical protein [Euryarchaeota archaeon]
MKKPEIFPEHILESIGLIEEYTRGKTKEDFLSSISLQDKVIRRIEITRDVVKSLSEESFTLFG